MALKTDIKEVFQKNTGRKVNKVTDWGHRITPNNKWKVYKIEIYVKNE
jgi:hypothetical protein